MLKQTKQLLKIDRELFREFKEYIDSDRYEEVRSGLEACSRRLETPTAQVVVAGSFSSGKSMFINALLNYKGSDFLCPEALRPTTSAITTICHGETLRIYQLLPSGRGGRKQQTIADYTRLVQHEAGGGHGAPQRRYAFEIEHPAEVLQHVVLVDTPGFNNPANAWDEQITIERMKDADVILWIAEIGSGTVKGSDLNVLSSGRINKPHGGIHLIFNKADRKKDRDQRDRIQRDARRQHGRVFDDVLVYSARDIKDGAGEFQQEHDAVLSLLKDSGGRARRFANARCKAELDGYLLVTRGMLEKVEETLEPFESLLSYLEGRHRKVCEMLEARRTKVSESLEESFCQCFDPVNVDKEEKDYWFSPYAKIIVDCDATKMKSLVKREFERVEEALKRICLSVRGRGLRISVDVSSEKWQRKLIAGYVPWLKKFEEKLKTGKHDDDYYDNVDEAQEDCENRARLTKASFTDGYEMLSGFIEAIAKEIKKDVRRAEAESRQRHPATRYNELKNFRKQILSEF